ncbi:MAG: ornithine carbamoyltransferase [Armatimonadetes bacterium]|nr:ornithine carbamoyltransferase [Armatimonadota bacterium]
MSLRHLLSISDLSPADIQRLYERTRALKEKLPSPTLQGKSIALVFEKPSLRTRVSFEVGMAQLGGYAVYLAPGDIRMGTREPVSDVAQNLSRWVDGIVARVFRHETAVELAQHSSVPVINALTDREHPCQALADLYTLLERFGSLPGRKLAFVGDGNNVCHSLLLVCARLGVHLSVATPEGYRPDAGIFEVARQTASADSRIEWVHDPAEAVRNADAVYTDVWVSMGQEEEREGKLRAFQGFQVNESLLSFARKGAAVMHCLPARRGEEISASALDGPQSVALDQAENRMHVQKGILSLMLEP